VADLMARCFTPRLINPSHALELMIAFQASHFCVVVQIDGERYVKHRFYSGAGDARLSGVLEFC